MKKLILITTVIFTSSMIFASRAQAACAFAASGNVNLGASCSIDANTTNGPDAGTGTTNTAVLEVSAGTVTVGTNATLAAGSISITGGIIAFASGAQVKPNTPLYAVDGDNDGYTSALTFYTTFVTGRVRRNLLNSMTVVDCNDGATSPTNCCLAPEYC